MDNSIVDITLEFLGIAFHNILYHTNVYPKSIFELRRKYSIVVYRSKHPEINQYMDLCLRSIAECLKTDKLLRVQFAITNSSYTPLLKFVFDFDKNYAYEETTDAYLIQTEQNLRAFCLKLSSVSHKFRNLSEDCSFSIYLHTNESCAVSLSINPDLEDFPLVEVEETLDESEKVLPIRSFSIRSFNVDSYVEFCQNSI